MTAYQRHHLLSNVEIEIGLDPLLRFRWAVQADYFARRVAQQDLTGLSDPSGNRSGLADARAALLREK